MVWIKVEHFQLSRGWNTKSLQTNSDHVTWRRRRWWERIKRNMQSDTGWEYVGLTELHCWDDIDELGTEGLRPGWRNRIRILTGLIDRFSLASLVILLRPVDSYWPLGNVPLRWVAHSPLWVIFWIIRLWILSLSVGSASQVESQISNNSATSFGTKAGPSLCPVSTLAFSLKPVW